MHSMPWLRRGGCIQLPRRSRRPRFIVGTADLSAFCNTILFNSIIWHLLVALVRSICYGCGRATKRVSHSPQEEEFCAALDGAAHLHDGPQRVQLCDTRPD